MKVFQLTLKSWRSTSATRETEAYLKWVKAPDEGWLVAWLREHGINTLVEEIDSTPLDTWGFEDGVDVILHPDEPMCEEWSPTYLAHVREQNMENNTDLAPHLFWLMESVQAESGMKEWVVQVTGVTKYGSHSHMQITTKAINRRMAILQVSGIDNKAIDWGCLPEDIVDIVAYEVVE